MKKTNLTHNELKKRLHYDKDTGVLTWTHSSLNSIRGKVAGSVHSQTGVRCIQINGEKWTDKQIAWFWMTGKVPNGTVRNKDKNALNCSFNNLELACPTSKLKHIHVNGKGGFRVCINGKYLGSAKTVEGCKQILNKHLAVQYILQQRASKQQLDKAAGK